MKATANTWRKQNGHEGCGVVILFDCEVQGWCNELRNPKDWQPGCIAIDEHGGQWVATGGNSYDGAESWQPIQQAA